MQWQKFSANNYCDRQLQLRRIIATACRAKSDLDFISKLEGARQELDESELWLELIRIPA